MFDSLRFAALLGVALAIPRPALAQTKDEERHAVTLCALAIPLMHAYVLNYEYLAADHHGLAVRLEYAPMIDTAEVDGTEVAGVFNYRYHLSPKMGSLFVGAYGRYRQVFGKGRAAGVDFDFTVPEVNVGLNVGYRWIVWKGFNAVFSAGYGYSLTKTRVSPDATATSDALHAFAKKNAQFMDAPFYGEFSIGYAF